MDEVAKIILDWLKSQSIGTVLILFALIWLYQKSKGDAAQHAESVKGALGQAEAERIERWKYVAESMASLRVRIEECEKDRRKMWQGMFRLGLRAKPNDDELAQE